MMKNRGIGATLASWTASLKPGTAFPLSAAMGIAAEKYPGVNRMAVSNALTGLIHKKLILPGPVRSTYLVAGRLNGAHQMNPSQAIYDLLDFMAKAEAPLRRAAKILEAVDSAG